MGVRRVAIPYDSVSTNPAICLRLEDEPLVVVRAPLFNNGSYRDRSLVDKNTYVSLSPLSGVFRHFQGLNGAWIVLPLLSEL